MIRYKDVGICNVSREMKRKQINK